MSEIPRFGQRSTTPRQEMCTKHPGRPAVAYCKRCNRPACADCSIPTEVGSICVDCAAKSTSRSQRFRSQSRVLASGTPVTATLVGISVALFVLDKIWPAVFQALALTPAAGYFEPWRLLTTAFLHGSFFHLLFNMLMLYVLGSAMERSVGWWRFLVIYLLSALGGSMAILGWVLVDPLTVGQATVGASGAIYGLLGGVFVAQRRSGMSTTSIVVLLAINLGYSLITPGISWQAHIGGFIAGLIVAAVYLWLGDYLRSASATSKKIWDAAVTIALIGGFALGTWGLYALILSSLGIQ